MIFGSVRHVRVFVYREPVDMRKAYDTLAALVEGSMKKSLVSGDVFVFIGRTRKSFGGALVVIHSGGGVGSLGGAA